jgi:FkbM family methyltransferase
MQPFVFSAWVAKWRNKLGEARVERRRRAVLGRINGLIHVGANTGQERALYATHGLRVVWVEPIPDVFDTLVKNLADYPTQKAYRYLLTGEDGQEFTLNISNYDGVSSSILPLAQHREMWPDVDYLGQINIVGTTLPAFLRKERLRLADYQALVLDTQGSEMLILKGAVEILGGFRFIQVEVPDFEAYAGCCLLPEMNEFMKSHGFREMHRDKFRSIPGVGSYYDVIYKRSLLRSAAIRGTNNAGNGTGG